MSNNASNQTIMSIISQYMTSRNLNMLNSVIVSLCACVMCDPDFESFSYIIHIGMHTEYKIISRFVVIA